MNPMVFRPSHRRQQIWVCVIAGLFFCDFTLCGYLPSHERLSSLLQAREHQRSTLRMAAAQGAELPGLKTRLHETEETVERFDRCVPADHSLGAFLQRMTALMTEHGLTEQMVLPGKEEKAEDLGCIPIHMTCQGTLTNLFDFFNTLRTMDRLVRVEKVLLENDAEFTGRVTMQADAYIFYRSKSSSTQQEVAGTEPRRAGHGA
ncbi:MAG: type 4a pilus biogenesis protein PilO [Solirubrobacterales bacterium]